MTHAAKSGSGRNSVVGVISQAFDLQQQGLTEVTVYRTKRLYLADCQARPRAGSWIASLESLKTRRGPARTC